MARFSEYGPGSTAEEESILELLKFEKLPNAETIGTPSNNKIAIASIGMPLVRNCVFVKDDSNCGYKVSNV